MKFITRASCPYFINPIKSNLQKVPNGPFPWTIAKKATNKEKNRYGNIVPCKYFQIYFYLLLSCFTFTAFCCLLFLTPGWVFAGKGLNDSHAQCACKSNDELLFPGVYNYGKISSQSLDIFILIFWLYSWSNFFRRPFTSCTRTFKRRSWFWLHQCLLHTCKYIDQCKFVMIIYSKSLKLNHLIKNYCGTAKVSGLSLCTF